MTEKRIDNPQATRPRSLNGGNDGSSVSAREALSAERGIPGTIHHPPQGVAAELSAKLAARSRHVCLLLGAGAGRSAGLPDLRGLEDVVVNAIQGADGELVKGLLDDRNLEDALSRLRSIRALVHDGGCFDSFDYASASRIDTAICQAIIEAVSRPDVALESFYRLGSWAARGDYHLPIEIFTINYDLLVETGLEQVGAPFFDGFVGHLRARFRADLVEAVDTSEPNRLPSSFVRLWKLHGSTNWIFDHAEGQRIIRTGRPAANEEAVAIYPSEEKYDDSRRVPFVVLMDRFRRALATPETILLVSGYSFGDQHLNEIIFDAAHHYPRSETVALCYGDIPEAVLSQAPITRNLTVLAASEAIIGGQRGDWAGDEDIPGVWKDGRFLLGDFRYFSTFLDRKPAGEDG